MRILVIDDEAEIRKMVIKMLRKESFEVVEASNGEEGLKILRGQSGFALVITDLIMPEKEGIETILEIKRDFSEIKILAISGGGKGNAQDYLELAKGLGADQTLCKPFMKSELCEVVNSLLNL